MPRLPRTPRTPRAPGGLGLNDVPSDAPGEERDALVGTVSTVGLLVSGVLVLLGGALLLIALVRATGGNASGVAGGLGAFTLLLCGGALLVLLLVVGAVWWLVRAVLGLVRNATGAATRAPARSSRANNNPLSDVLDRFLR